MSDALGAPGPNPRGNIISDLGLDLELDGDQLLGRVQVFPQLLVPGTDCLRISVMAAYVDVLTGVLCLDAFAGRVPVTLDLDVQLFRPPSGFTQVDAVATTLKVGRSIAIAEVAFTADDDSTPFAVGSASFVAAPDASLTIPSRAQNVRTVRRLRGTLTTPFAERAGCERIGAGMATLARRDDGLNAADSINGGLIALVVEEASLSATSGQTLSSIDIRYLRAARVGPIVGTALGDGDVARVEVRDTGSDDRLVVRAITRAFGV